MPSPNDDEARPPTEETPAGDQVEVQVDEPQAATTPEERIAQLEQEKKETYDRFLRSAADFDNYRKRARRDQDEAALKAREAVLKEMLPVVDNLERALSASQAAQGSAIVDGVKLVLRQFASALERFDVKPVEALGRPFDPAFHEAITQIQTADQPTGTVVAEMQRGYTIGNRLLRPALVAVAKAPEGATPAPSEGSPHSPGGGE